MKTVLSIAGSDPSGGAGIQADIKTVTMNGAYAMAAVTALTVQNTLGVYAVSEVASEILRGQIDAVFEDIVPDAVKIGMTCSAEQIRLIAERLKSYGAKNVVVDPVMVSTSGTRLMDSEAVSVLQAELLPTATLVTPNIPEAEILAGMKISTEEDMKTAAKRIGETCGCSVLLKGGHSEAGADDVLYSEEQFYLFKAERINNPNTHGTGCTLSSAVAANLAKGFDLENSVKRAKEYITGAIKDLLDLGKGNGPLNHLYQLKGKFAEEAKNKKQ